LGTTCRTSRASTAHEAIRNAASTVTSAVVDWCDKVERFATAVGDNFDFSCYRRTLWAVCTPHIVYVASGAALDVRDSLRWFTSLENLLCLPMAPSSQLWGPRGNSGWFRSVRLPG
jgi:hypothetical protein